MKDAVQFFILRIKCTFKIVNHYSTDRRKNHGLAECLVIVTSRWDFGTIGVSFISTHIKSLTGLPRRGKMLVENKIRKNRESRRDVTLTLSVSSDCE